MTRLQTHESEEQILRRIYREYLEMPGLQLTCRQAQRLFGLDELTCARLLEALVTDKFLTRQHQGAYVRLGEGTASSRPSMTSVNTPPLSGFQREHSIF